MMASRSFLSPAVATITMTDDAVFAAAQTHHLEYNLPEILRKELLSVCLKAENRFKIHGRVTLNCRFQGEYSCK